MNTQINPIEIPLKGIGTQLFIRTSTDGIYEPTGVIYFQLLTDNGKELISENIPLSVEEVEAWGDSMEYIENIVLSKLGLIKK